MAKTNVVNVVQGASVSSSLSIVQGARYIWTFVENEAIYMAHIVQIYVLCHIIL